jgi:hypothetical protein
VTFAVLVVPILLARTDYLLFPVFLDMTIVVIAFTISS